MVSKKKTLLSVTCGVPNFIRRGYWPCSYWFVTANSTGESRSVNLPPMWLSMWRIFLSRKHLPLPSNFLLHVSSYLFSATHIRIHVHSCTSRTALECQCHQHKELHSSWCWNTLYFPFLSLTHYNLCSPRRNTLWHCPDATAMLPLFYRHFLLHSTGTLWHDLLV